MSKRHLSTDSRTPLRPFVVLLVAMPVSVGLMFLNSWVQAPTPPVLFLAGLIMLSTSIFGLVRLLLLWRKVRAGDLEPTALTAHVGDRVFAQDLWFYGWFSLTLLAGVLYMWSWLRQLGQA
jgi:uncharacterized membrane protein YfbV (UPF0208 family)